MERLFPILKKGRGQSLSWPHGSLIGRDISRIFDGCLHLLAFSAQFMCKAGYNSCLLLFSSQRLEDFESFAWSRELLCFGPGGGRQLSLRQPGGLLHFLCECSRDLATGRWLGSPAAETIRADQLRCASVEAVGGCCPGSKGPRGYIFDEKKVGI